jgi:hypothetical protein
MYVYTISLGIWVNKTLAMAGKTCTDQLWAHPPPYHVVYIDGMRLSLNCGNKWTYCSSVKLILEWSPGGMIMTGENWGTWIKACPSAILSTTNPTWTDPDTNLGLNGERPATNHEPWHDLLPTLRIPGSSFFTYTVLIKKDGACCWPLTSLVERLRNCGALPPLPINLHGCALQHRNISSYMTLSRSVLQCLTKSVKLVEEQKIFVVTETKA